jgi:hypothetical protein
MGKQVSDSKKHGERLEAFNKAALDNKGNINNHNCIESVLIGESGT